jgi:nicotinamide-nucleotide amidase
MADSIRAALGPGKIVIVSGGLGPTEDDVTRDAAADALGRRLPINEEVLQWLRDRFKRFGREMAKCNERQCYVIEGAEVLTNDRGTAPGQFIEQDGALVFLLPGPPFEMKAMYEREVAPRLAARLPKALIRTVFLRVTGMGESDLDQLIAPVYTKVANPATTILAGGGDIQIHLRARAESEEEAGALLAAVARPIEELLGDRVYSRDGSPLEAIVGLRLRERGATVATAESCTGGMLGQRITSIPGSSEYFAGGFVTYTNAIKIALLGVDPALLEAHTAVSEPVAIQMAARARERTGASYALSVTGVAGPDGGTDELPVGTVFIGLAGPGGASARRFRFPGDRARIRAFACQAALDMLRRRLAV